MTTAARLARATAATVALSVALATPALAGTSYRHVTGWKLGTKSLVGTAQTVTRTAGDGFVVQVDVTGSRLSLGAVTATFLPERVTVACHRWDGFVWADATVERRTPVRQILARCPEAERGDYVTTAVTWRGRIAGRHVVTRSLSYDLRA
jgi:hypothetical protein